MAIDVGQIKTKYQAIKNLTVENYKVNSFKHIIPQIEKGVLYNIITQKVINPYTFILTVLSEHKTIEELHIATYRVSEAALTNFKYMLDNKLIGNFILLVNDNYETLMRDKVNILLAMDRELDNFKLIKKNSHAKITLIKVADKHLVIQGSGNYSTNPKIEQYSIMDNEKLYNFHKEWING